MEQELSAWGMAGLFLAGGMLFVLLGLVTSRILRPSRPNPEKLSTYECGEAPVGTARVQLNPRFYVIALIFLIFEVEVLFLFPWATVYADPGRIHAASGWGWVALAEAGLFVLALLAGLAWVWRKGDLDWVKPRPVTPVQRPLVPESVYETFNQSVDALNPHGNPGS